MWHVPKWNDSNRNEILWLLRERWNSCMVHACTDDEKEGSKNAERNRVRRELVSSPRDSFLPRQLMRVRNVRWGMHGHGCATWSGWTRLEPDSDPTQTSMLHARAWSNTHVRAIHILPMHHAVLCFDFIRFFTCWIIWKERNTGHDRWQSFYLSFSL